MKHLFNVISTLVAGLVLLSPPAIHAQSLSKAGGHLTTHVVPDTPLMFSNLRYGPLNGTAEQMARTYLSNHLSTLKMKSGLADISVAAVQSTPGGQHVRFNQLYNNIPIYQADLVVSLDSRNYVQFVLSNYKSGFTTPTTTPAISQGGALQRARAHLAVSGKLHGEESATLMVKVEKNAGRLIYRVVVPAFEPRGDWEVLVDAVSGEIIEVSDMTCFDRSDDDPAGPSSINKADGSAFVFDPDPLSTSGATYGDAGYLDNSDADSPQLTAQRVLRQLRDITFTGGQYTLVGPYVTPFDWDPPNTPVVTAAHPDSFRYTRFQDGFEDVMVYYHLDRTQRYIQSLGFTNIQNNSIQADPHGFSGADNSAYYPSTNRLTFGEGGVDDAEDADVILHEYGHAIHNGSVPGWSGSSQQGALGEGFGDYWAESYSRSLSHWLPSQAPYFWVFDWDGHNPFWAGRVLNYTPHYPEGLTGTIHTDGQMWSSTLMNIWNEIGASVLDKLVLKSHFYLTASGVTMTQNAEAVIQADRDLYGGSHLQSIVYWFGQRGFINPANYVPQITHAPLRDTENMTGPYEVTATIVPGATPLVPSSLKVFWTRTGVFGDSLAMSPTGTPNQYRAFIPGNGISATYRYYVSARDSGGAVATHPSGAPGSYHSFRAGLDTIPPIISHVKLRDQAKIRWPATVRATVTDNIGVDSVWVDFLRQRGSLSGSFRLTRTTGDDFQGVFPLDTSQVIIGDSIFYKVVARDQALAGNLATHPATGIHKFAIISARGVVLVVDDDATTAKWEVPDKGVDDRPASLKGIASRLIARTLGDVGFVIDTAGFATHDPSTYVNYDIVVWSAGARTGTMFNDAAKRAALVTRASSGGKIWIEGGEVGYVYRKSGTTTDLDPSFRRTVLHDSLWLSDVTSSTLVITQPTHPIFTSPNPISGPIALTSTGVGVRDAMRLQPGDPYVKKIAGWSTYTVQGPDTAGIVIYNPLPDPTVGQIVFQMFSVGAITDTTVAKKLIENTAEFLMTPPGGALLSTEPAALSFGPVQLGDSLRLSFRVRNLGAGTLSVTNITNVHPRLIVYPKVFSLASQDTLRVYATFKPLQVENLNDTIRFVSNATAPPFVAVTGRGGIPLMSVSPDSFSFSLPPTSDTTRASLMIRNTGTDTLVYALEEVLGADITGSIARSRQQQPSYELPKGVPDSRHGDPVTDGSGGPDAFGYIWIDSDEPGGPTFNWIDISGIGTPVTNWTGSADDGYATVPLPFAFPFYGTDQTTINIVTNGFLNFGASSTAYSNAAIPTAAAPNNALFPFWDDMDLRTSGSVHYYSDAVNQRFIIQYTNVPHYSGTPAEPGVYTFQVILKPSGDILYQYLDMQQTLNSATIGIEDAAGAVGLQVAFNTTYVHNNLAILHTRDAVRWLSCDRLSGVVVPGDSQRVEVRLHPVSMTAGDYHANLKVTSNTPTVRYVPIHLRVLSVNVDEFTGLPTEFALSQNYPNPFNPTTSIKFALPVEANVSLKIYNLLGQEVKALVNELKIAGYHEAMWDGANAYGNTVGSGVYFFRFEASPISGGSKFTQIRKMVLLK